MSRSYCFTLNNYTEEHLELIFENWACNRYSKDIRYMIFGYEIGEKGTMHLQGYLELFKPQRLTGIKRIIGIEQIHWEIRRGTREQARDYCMKEGSIEEFGDWEAGGQGSRTDLTRVLHAIDTKTPIREIMETFPNEMASRMRFFEKYRELIEKEDTREFRKVETHLLIGDAGSGKTRTVHDLCPGIFTVNPEDTFPFEGYDGEEAILIDDFNGQLMYKHLLKILDGHQLRINIKGGHRYARWKQVFITSNEIPESWYKYGLTPALKRRISDVTWFGNEEAGNTVPLLDI